MMGRSALVLVADHVEDQPFADMEADADLPLLPAHQMALDREARPFRLGDFKRLQVGAQCVAASMRLPSGGSGTTPKSSTRKTFVGADRQPDAGWRWAAHRVVAGRLRRKQWP